MDGVHNEKLLYGSSLKNLFFFLFWGEGWWGWCMKKQFFWIADLRGGLTKKEKRRGYIFKVGEGLRPQCTLRVGEALLAQISKANNIVTQYYY